MVEFEIRGLARDMKMLSSIMIAFVPNVVVTRGMTQTNDSNSVKELKTQISIETTKTSERL